MTIVVTIKVNDGMVLASDSATTFSDSAGTTVKVYNNANKIFNLVKGLPLGAMTYGSGSIGTASIATLSKDLRLEFGKPTSPYHFDFQDYSVEQVAKLAHQFFQDKFQEAYPNGKPNSRMGYRISGYGSTDSLAQGWEFYVGDGITEPPSPFYSEQSYGPRWAGDGEALDRLVLGYSSQIYSGLTEGGMSPEAWDFAQEMIVKHSYRELSLPAMHIQDAIELARYLAETAAKFSHFSLLAPTIGGPIEIATITKHEGFKWVARKHYFPSTLN